MTPLRVLHVNTSDRAGGAARAAHRICTAQRHAGIDSHMLVVDRTEAAAHVHMPLGRLGKLALMVKRAAMGRILGRQHTPTNPVLHSANALGAGLVDWINASSFDIVNLHWVGGEMLSISDIARIRQPLVWTMHDMWPFSGAEHYDDLDNPGRYRHAYTAASRPPGYSGPDIDRLVWQRKKRRWSNTRINLVSPSRWLADCAVQSALFAHQPCRVIPNCVDTTVFKPLDRILARQVLNLDPSRRYILFGALSSTSDPRKGFHLLQTALHRSASDPVLRDTTELLIFGAQAPATPPDLGLPAHYLGTLNDDISLALLYAAADVFAAPSMQDNLPNTLVEASACGTPSIAFAIGGMPELIAQGTTGALIPAFSTDLFADGLATLLHNPLPRPPIRTFATDRFSPTTVARQYAGVYDEAVGFKKV